MGLIDTQRLVQGDTHREGGVRRQPLPRTRTFRLRAGDLHPLPQRSRLLPIASTSEEGTGAMTRPDLRRDTLREAPCVMLGVCRTEERVTGLVWMTETGGRMTGDWAPGKKQVLLMEAKEAEWGTAGARRTAERAISELTLRTPMPTAPRITKMIETSNRRQIEVPGGIRETRAGIEGGDWRTGLGSIRLQAPIGEALSTGPEWVEMPPPLEMEITKNQGDLTI